MTIYRCLIFVSLLTSPLHPQAVQTDTAQMGLRGLVRMVQERRTVYEERNGVWVRQPVSLVRKVEFNEAGYKTEEQFYSGRGRRNTYAYDEAGRLVAREEYSAGRLVSSWEKSFDPDGSGTLQLRYNTDGSVSSKIVLRFDTAGEKLSEIHYDDKGIIVQRWERRQTATGAVISHSPRWGGYEITRFDSQGQITEMRKGSGDTLQKWTYDYDTRGRLTEARYSDGTAFSPDVYTFRYDSNDKLLEVSHSRMSGVLVVKRRYTYSGSTTAETVDWFDQEGRLDHTWIYSYDTAGNIVDKEYRHAQRPFSCQWAYRYDLADRITMVTFYDSQGRVFTMTETTYDGMGNKISERSSGRGFAMGFRVIYEYDAAGRLLETVRYDLDGRLQSRESSRYNETGDLTESARARGSRCTSS